MEAISDKTSNVITRQEDLERGFSIEAQNTSINDKLTPLQIQNIRRNYKSKIFYNVFMYLLLISSVSFIIFQHHRFYKMYAYEKY